MYSLLEESGGSDVRLEQETRWSPIRHIRAVVGNLPAPRFVGDHEHPQDPHHPMDHLELCLPAGLAFRLDVRPSASPRQECLALARAVHLGSAAHLDDLRLVPPTTVVIVVDTAIIEN